MTDPIQLASKNGVSKLEEYDMSAKTETTNETTNVDGEMGNAHAIRDAIQSALGPTQVRDAETTPGSAVMKKVELTLDTNERQERYVKSQEARGNGVGLVFADAFIRGMRDIGYKSPAWALSEMTDNSLQGGATEIEIRFGYDKSSSSQFKPDWIAVVDNGAGIISKMISYAVRWGGTDRENDRHGFGRYGYGLPSSAVSLAKRYTVYSKTATDGWHAVTVDLEALATAGGDLTKIEALLKARRASLPPWLSESPLSESQINVATLESGTIIVLEDIDRLKQTTGWITTKTLKSKLLQHFGVIYRHWLQQVRITVDGVRTEVVDPLFLMPEGRLYDETSVSAIPVYDHAFEMDSSRGTKGVVRIRAALLPPDFQSAVPGKIKRGGTNKRLEIMKDYNGILMCREGRQIDCIAPPWTTFGVYDRNVKVEVDFDPELDEYFGITTAKQQIVVAEQMWEKLRQSGREAGGLYALIQDMRDRREELRKQLDAAEESVADTEVARPSEEAMAAAEKFRVRRVMPTPRKVTDAKTNLEQEIQKVARDTGEAPETVRQKLETRAEVRPWEVDFEYIEEGPFFIPKRMGAFQKRIVINTAHPFYTKVYNQAEGIKSALEVLLFVLADGELDAEGEREAFYKSERQHWSTLLRHALDKLVSDEVVMDGAIAKREGLELQAAGANPAEVKH
jgi:hypothetical protein